VNQKSRQPESVSCPRHCLVNLSIYILTLVYQNNNGESTTSSRSSSLISNLISYTTTLKKYRTTIHSKINDQLSTFTRHLTPPTIIRHDNKPNIRQPILGRSLTRTTPLSINPQFNPSKSTKTEINTTKTTPIPRPFIR